MVTVERYFEAAFLADLPLASKPLPKATRPQEAVILVLADHRARRQSETREDAD